MAAGWSSQLLPAQLTMRLWLTLRECSQTHTHSVTEQSSQKQHPNTAETRAHINQTHSLAHTHTFACLTIAIHPVSLLLYSPLLSLLTLGHDLQTETVEQTRRSQSQSKM